MQKIRMLSAASTVVALFALSALAVSALTINVESSTSNAVQTKLLDKKGANASGSSLLQENALSFGTASPTKTKGNTRSSPQGTASPLTLAATAPSLGPNLIQNPGFETPNSSNSSLPQGWQKGGYGTNTRVLTYPVTSWDGSKGVSVQISSYTSGDAKWYFTDVPITAGSTYQFSDQYVANVPTVIDVRFTMNDGTFKYVDIGFPAAVTAMQTATYQFTAPAGATAATVFHIINKVGTLTLDNYSLNEMQTSPPPPPPPTDGNLVPNGDMELSSGTAPTGWKSNKWGTMTANFSYPVSSFDGSKAVKTAVTSWASGDAKWYFSPIQLSSGIYTYYDEWTANVPTYVTAQLENSDGTFTYKDLGSVPARGWSWLEVDFTVPPGTKSVTVYHLINRVGSLTIDNVKVTKKSDLGGIFETGAVTLRFDDGWDSQFINAVPKLNSLGMKGTFYIVTRQLEDYGFSGFMTIAEIKQIAAAGHEIGAHTRTHTDLTTLSTSQQQTEISGSRQDILGWNVGPVRSFAYPYGAYNSTTIQLVKNAGFESAAATIGGFALPTSDPYQLERQPVDSNITLDQLKAWVDQAQSGKKWLIFTIHQIQPTLAQCPDKYCTSVDIFNGLADYIAQKGIPVVTTSQGFQSLQ